MEYEIDASTYGLFNLQHSDGEEFYKDRKEIDSSTWQVSTVLEYNKKLKLFPKFGTSSIKGKSRHVHTKVSRPKYITLVLFYKQNMIKKTSWTFLDFTGCSNAKPDVLNTYQAIKSALLSQKNKICIWLKVTSMASTASDRKSAKNP